MTSLSPRPGQLRGCRALGRVGVRVQRYVLVPALAIVGLALAAAALWTTNLHGVDERRQARRILRWHGDLCEPKIVSRSEDQLWIVCADGERYIPHET